MTQRGANVALDVNAALGAAPTLDVTAAVLAVVNQNTAPLNVTAPPQQQPAAQAPATPAPATTTPQRPRQQGR